jgi:hypothetical protein
MRLSDPTYVKLFTSAHIEQLRGRPLPRRRRTTRSN